MTARILADVTATITELKDLELLAIAKEREQEESIVIDINVL